MRSEHDEIRRLVGEFVDAPADVGEGRMSLGRSLALRRVMFQLYALLKIHLAEEDAYLRIVDRGGGRRDSADVIAAALEHPVAGDAAPAGGPAALAATCRAHHSPSHPESPP